jgi:hypothetical protein
MKNVIMMAVFCFTAISVFAQSKEIEAYKKESEEMRKTVWAWPDEQYKVRTVPEKYMKSSKVVIAHHTALTADSKSGIAFYGLGFGSRHKQSITEIVREVIKLNDKNAVTEYSELSFTQFEKRSGFYASDKTSTFVGVRIVKPDGSTKEINADEVVLTKDEKNEKQAKLAVPDLLPGDIIDYYIATAQNTTNDFSSKPYNLLLFDDAPVLHYSFHSELGKKFAVEYRSYNGAPEVKVSRNGDGDIIMDVSKKDMPAFETSLWVSASRQLPFIRMYIGQGYKGMGSKMMGLSKPGEITKVIGSQHALEDIQKELSGRYATGYWMKSARYDYEKLENKAKENAKQVGLSYKELSEKDKATLLFYTFRYEYMLKADAAEIATRIKTIAASRFDNLSFLMFCIFKASGLDPAILIAEERTGYRMNEAINSNDLVTAAHLPSLKSVFAFTSVYDLPFSVPVSIEGTKGARSITFDNPAIMTPAKMNNLAQVGAAPPLPASTSTVNNRTEKLKILLNNERSGLQVKRQTTLKGYYKLEAQSSLLLYEDFFNYESAQLKEKYLTLSEVISQGKQNKKFFEEATNALAEARSKQKDAFIKDAKEWFEEDVTNLTDYKIEIPGVRHTAPDFIYSSSFNLNGLIKKAGNNIIVEIGKIQGKPLTVKEEQRNRTLDVYMPFARSIEYEIELEIPEDYTAEGVDALNTKVENETGYFITEATSNGKTVSIKIKKHYLHNFEPAANFSKLMAFMDASSNWTNAKLLLKKK